jgi:hypothetical protein
MDENNCLRDLSGLLCSPTRKRGWSYLLVRNSQGGLTLTLILRSLHLQHRATLLHTTSKIFLVPVMGAATVWARSGIGMVKKVEPAADIVNTVQSET